MGKNIVICCDGTSNEYSDDRTNVIKLYASLLHDPVQQMTFYHPGVGTMGPPGALTQFDTWWTTTLGLAAGYGLMNDIRDAYVFLSNTYEPDDDVFIFGFSRGAYTARCLAAVIHMYGLIRKGDDPLVPYATRMIQALSKAHKAGQTSDVFELAAGFKHTFSQECPIHFVGVWDTVSSVGWFLTPLRLPYTAENPGISIGRHAMAIDERRAFFPPNLWWPHDHDPTGPKDLKQVWFPGSHSDVGGGYPESESAQSKYALEWMLVEARKAGLHLDLMQANKILGRPASKYYVPPGVDQPLHESLTWKWWLTEWVPKPHYDRATKRQSLRANWGRRREIPPDALVHESAQLRGPAYLKRLPGDITIVPHPTLPNA